MGPNKLSKDVEIPKDYKIHFLTMSDGVELRCLTHKPNIPKGRVFIYPGMNTLVLSWINILEGLVTENYWVDYVESREKHTANYPSKIELTKERMIQDCYESASMLKLEDEGYIAIGSSLGSTTLIHCMAEHNLIPKHSVLVGPNPNFKVPFAIRLLLPLVTTWSYRNLGKPLMKSVVLKIFTNEKKDPKQYRKYALALELAEPIRLKKGLKEWRGNKVWDILNKINGDRTICYLIGASEDKLHPDEVTKKVSNLIKNSKFVDLKTNTAAHEQPLIDMVKAFK